MQRVEQLAQNHHNPFAKLVEVSGVERKGHRGYGGLDYGVDDGTSQESADDDDGVEDWENDGSNLMVLTHFQNA